MSRMGEGMTGDREAKIDFISAVGAALDEHMMREFDLSPLGDEDKWYLVQNIGINLMGVWMARLLRGYAKDAQPELMKKLYDTFCLRLHDSVAANLSFLDTGELPVVPGAEVRRVESGQLP